MSFTNKKKKFPWFITKPYRYFPSSLVSSQTTRNEETDNKKSEIKVNPNWKDHYIKEVERRKGLISELNTLSAKELSTKYRESYGNISLYRRYSDEAIQKFINKAQRKLDIVSDLHELNDKEMSDKYGLQPSTISNLRRRLIKEEGAPREDVTCPDKDGGVWVPHERMSKTRKLENRVEELQKENDELKERIRLLEEQLSETSDRFKSKITDVKKDGTCEMVAV